MQGPLRQKLRSFEVVKLRERQADLQPVQASHLLGFATSVFCPAWRKEDRKMIKVMIKRKSAG